MDYRVFDFESRAPLDTLELHVLARAYYAAWRAVHGTTPESRHPMPMFNAFFEFDDSLGIPMRHIANAAPSIAGEGERIDLEEKCHEQE